MPTYFKIQAELKLVLNIYKLNKILVQSPPDFPNGLGGYTPRPLPPVKGGVPKPPYVKLWANGSTVSGY